VTSSSDDWIGLDVAAGQYKILGRIGQGSMGRVYLAYDDHLETDVVLKFVHAQKHIHRDVKPANILFDRHGNAFLGDFGITKAFAVEETDRGANSLTAPGFLLGTPNYVAPEIVMGRAFDGRVDQYSLAMTVHEVLSGTNCMEGPTPSATVVNQTMVVPPALAELRPGIPRPMSDAILRGLAKNPAERFDNCVALAQEVLAAAPSATVIAERPPTAVINGPMRPACSKKSVRAGAIGGLLAVGVLALIVAAMERGPWRRSSQALLATSPSDALALVPPAGQPSPVVVATDSDTVEINVTYGTKKQRWPEEATAEFQKTPTGRSIKVNLHGMGSMEGARVVLDGPKPMPFRVWSPASSAYRDAFEHEWRANHDNKPILKSDNLALTPMVFVMWEDRREAFIKKYAKLCFQTVYEAMEEQGGWETIARQARWGRFNFGHANPGRSNSGLLTLVLMA
jgi:hypothetical protein